MKARKYNESSILIYDFKEEAWVVKNHFSLYLPKSMAITTGFNSILIHTFKYNDEECSLLIQNLVHQFNSNELQITPSIEVNNFVIPVLYDYNLELDTKDISSELNLTPDKIFRLHQKQKYTVKSIGFLPYFFYLGKLDQQLKTKRKKKYSSSIEAGTVAIADLQTAIYPVPTPAGWNQIGKTPLNFIAPQIDLDLIKEGDIISFKSIDENEYNKLKEMKKWN